MNISADAKSLIDQVLHIQGELKALADQQRWDEFGHLLATRDGLLPGLDAIALGVSEEDAPWLRAQVTAIAEQNRQLVAVVKAYQAGLVNESSETKHQNKAIRAYKNNP